jgi:hypothetical protein
MTGEGTRRPAGAIRDISPLPQPFTETDLSGGFRTLQTLFEAATDVRLEDRMIRWKLIRSTPAQGQAHAADPPARGERALTASLCSQSTW